MKITQYRPNFFEGFETEVYEFNSVDELYNTPLCKRFISDDFKGFRLCREYLMAQYTDKSWTVGYFEKDDVDKLKNIIPTWGI